MLVCCLDLEGILVPEIWIEVAKKTKIRDLRFTTRDIPNYDVLMRRRLKILREHRIKLKDIQRIISRIRPLPGAKSFLDKLRARTQVLILSDTYYEFAIPLMRQLGFPALWCNGLTVDRAGYISRYHLRQKNGKEKAVRALKSIGFRVKAVGDSYNDLTMLKAAHQGILFNPPPPIARDRHAFKIANSYGKLLDLLAD